MAFQANNSCTTIVFLKGLGQRRGQQHLCGLQGWLPVKCVSEGGDPDVSVPESTCPSPPQPNSSLVPP